MVYTRRERDGLSAMTFLGVNVFLLSGLVELRFAFFPGFNDLFHLLTASEGFSFTDHLGNHLTIPAFVGLNEVAIIHREQRYTLAYFFAVLHHVCFEFLGRLWVSLGARSSNSPLVSSLMAQILQPLWFLPQSLVSSGKRGKRLSFPS